MNDYIERQAAIDAVSGLPTWYGDGVCLPFGDPQPPMEALLIPEDVVSAIDNLPSADVAPVRHGRWIVKGQDIFCSVCREESAYNWHGASKFSNYCPNCGARLDGMMLKSKYIEPAKPECIQIILEVDKCTEKN